MVPCFQQELCAHSQRLMGHTTLLEQLTDNRWHGHDLPHFRSYFLNVSTGHDARRTT